MKNIRLDNTFFQIFPECRMAVLTCKGFDNGRNEEATEKMLGESMEKGKKFVPEPVFMANRTIGIWRNAFDRFPIKRGAKPQLEILLKYVHKDKVPESVNPMVNIINSIAMEYGLNVWGLDYEKLKGDLVLTRSEGDEIFTGPGRTSRETPFVAELIYKDDEGAVTRCWNWEQADRTLIREDTTTANIIIESLRRREVLEQAAEDISGRIQRLLGGHVTAQYLDMNHRSCELGVTP